MLYFYFLVASASGKWCFLLILWTFFCVFCVFCIYIMVTLLRLFGFGCTVPCLLWSKKCFLMPPMVEEKNFSYASYGPRKASLCLIRRGFTCAGFSLFYNFTIFYFVLLVGLTSAEYFHPSYFLYITNDLFFTCFSWKWSLSAWWQLFLAATVVSTVLPFLEKWQFCLTATV